MEETENSSWPHQIAGASVIAPGLVVAMSVVFRAVQQNTQLQSRAIVLAVAGLGALLLVFGFLFSIIAMCAIPRYGSDRILGRSIVGFLANGLLLFIGVTNFMQARQQALARNAATTEMRATARELQSQLQKNYDPKLGVTNSRPGMDQLKRLDNQFQIAARNATGDEAAALQAMSDHLQRMQTAASRFQVAVQKYTAANVLSAATLSDKADIERRRESVRIFIAANNEVKQVAMDTEKNIRAHMAKRGIAPAKIEEAIQSYRQTAAPRTALVLQIRDCDQRIANATWDILSLLESDWGHWHHDPKSNTLRFENSQSGARYNKLLDDISAAGSDEVRLQGQLLKSR